MLDVDTGLAPPGPARISAVPARSFIHPAPEPTAKC